MNLRRHKMCIPEVIFSPKFSPLFKVKREYIVFKDYSNINLTKEEIDKLINHKSGEPLPHTTIDTIFIVQKIRDIKCRNFCLCEIVPINKYQGQFLVVDNHNLKAFHESTSA